MSKVWQHTNALQFVSPFQVLIQVPSFSFTLFCFGLFQVISMVFLIDTIRSRSIQSFKAIRVVSNSSIAANSVLRFGKAGCETEHLFVPRNSTQILDSFTSEPIIFDGFAAIINISEGSEGTISINIDGSNDNWKTASHCGSLDVRWTAKGIRFSPSPVPIREKFVISFHPPWHWYWSVVLPRALLALGCIGTVCVAYLWSPTAAKTFCTCTVSAACTASILSAIGLTQLGATAAAATAVCVTALTSSLSVLQRADRFNVDVLALLSALWLVSAVVKECASADSQGCPAALIADPPLLQAAAAGLFLLFLAKRLRFHARALRATDDDLSDASLFWSQLQETEPGPLRRLDIVCREMAERLPRCYARQLDSRRRNSNKSPGMETVATRRSAAISRFWTIWSAGLGRTGKAASAAENGSGKLGLPVTSLDRLYSQVCDRLFFHRPPRAQAHQIIRLA